MIKPYFETKLGKLYHGDCLDIMPELEPVDLVLTDPPYGIGEACNKNESRGLLAKSKAYPIEKWDDEPPPPKYFKQIFSISKNQILFGGNYFINNLYPTPCFLVWDKENGNTDFADCEIAWTSFTTATRIIKYKWHGMLKKVPEKRFHRNQKPLGLFTWILNKYADIEHVILDTHLGSGTTAVACEYLKRKWIGIEIGEKHCEIAAIRIEEGLSVEEKMEMVKNNKRKAKGLFF